MVAKRIMIKNNIAEKILIYGILLFWTFICLFPIYWTATTSFKTAASVTQGLLITWVDFEPSWKGWKFLGLSPDTIFTESTGREEFLARFTNTAIISSCASALASILGSFAAYGLS